jgi:alpha-ribazole phosphatase
MDLYLIRHTQPNVGLGVCYGQTDLDVAYSFKDEFARLQPKLSHLGEASIFSSPLQRCLKLAQATQAHLKILDIKIDERLMELNFGDWELKPWAEIPQGIVGEWTEAHIQHKPPNGESYFDLHTRTKGFFEEVQKIESAQNLLVFTHAGVIRALVAEALNLPLTHAVKLQIDYGSVSKITVQDGFSSIGFINR